MERWTSKPTVVAKAKCAAHGSKILSLCFNEKIAKSVNDACDIAGYFLSDFVGQLSVTVLQQMSWTQLVQCKLTR